MAIQNIGGHQLPSSSGLFLKRDFGAVGDDSTDDTTAVNNWLGAATSNSGPVLYAEPGTYKITDAITNTKTGLLIQGLGFISAGPGAQSNGMGAVFSQHTASKWCWIQGAASSAVDQYQGCNFRNIGFKDGTAAVGSGTALGGLILYSGNNLVETCSASFFATGSGFKTAIASGGSDAASLNRFIVCSANDCLKGFYDTAGYTTLIDCIGQQFSVGGIAHTGTGAHISAASSAIFGGLFESFDVGLLSDAPGGNGGVVCIGTRFEDNVTWDINLNRASGSSATNNLIVAPTTKINIGAFNLNDVLIGRDSSGAVTDAGTGTVMYGASYDQHGSPVTKITVQSSGATPTGGHNGEIRGDDSTNKIWFKFNGTWKSVTLT